MSPEELKQRLMATFLDEVEEHVMAWNAELLALEDTPDGPQRKEHLHALFRTAHSVKGAARVVGVNLLERVSHSLESLLNELRRGERALEPDLFRFLFRVGEGLGEVALRLRSQQPLEDSVLAGQLDELASWVGPVAPPLAPAPATLRRSGAAPGRAGAGPPAPKPREPVESAAPSPATVTSPAPRSESVAGELLGGATIRVAAKKLDGLLEHTGEFVTLGHHFAGAMRELAELVDELSSERRVSPLRRAYRRSAVSARQTALDSEGRGQGVGYGDPATRARMLDEVLKRLRSVSTDLGQRARVLVQASRQLDESARGLRTAAFAEACLGLEPMARDLAQSVGKRVELELDGADIEVDRAVLTQLVDPLRHLVRNAIDHGLESEDERVKRGKSAVAHVRVAAELRGAQVQISVSDDGRGLDLGAIREQIARRGLLVPQRDPELLGFVFQPGFSTAQVVTQVSGRGVGLDVVRARVETLHGSVEVLSEPERGATFRMLVPLTLTTVRALLVRVGTERLALATPSVVKLYQLGEDDLIRIEGREAFLTDAGPIHAVALGELLGLPATPQAENPEVLRVVVLASGNRQVGVVVDELLGEQELVVKGLGRRLRGLPYVAGASLLADGGVALILNAAELLRGASGLRPGQALSDRLGVGREIIRKRVIIADDSITTRTLEESILESAGYEVAVAASGDQAWALLQQHGADLVVADVEMPGMDGFTLAEAIRGSTRFRHVPVVLVTTLDSEEHRARGLQAGADAYVVKSAFDQQNLLAIIRRLL